MTGVGRSNETVPGAKPRALKWRFLDDLDRHGADLPAAQRDVVRRIALHANEDGSGSHPSILQLAEELGGKSGKAIRDALNGRPDRGWAPMIGTWLRRTTRGTRETGASEYQLLDAHERTTAPNGSGCARQATTAPIGSGSPESTGTKSASTATKAPDQVHPMVPLCDPSSVIPSCDPEDPWADLEDPWAAAEREAAELAALVASAPSFDD